jgi:hypothetical protein
MLIFLRIAEPVAQGVAFAAPGRPVAACEDDGPAAALQLAARLRMLACLVLALAGTMPRQPAPLLSERSENATEEPHRRAAPTPVRLDTS